jgi:hypothetical protein
MNMSLTSAVDPLHQQPDDTDEHTKIQDPKHGLVKSRLHSEMAAKRKGRTSENKPPDMFADVEQQAKDWAARKAEASSVSSGSVVKDDHPHKEFFQPIASHQGRTTSFINPEITLEVMRVQDIEKIVEKYNYASVSQLTNIVQMTLREVCAKNQFMALDKMYDNMFAYASIWESLLIEHLENTKLNKKGTEEDIVMSYLKGMSASAKKNVLDYLMKWGGVKTS